MTVLNKPRLMEDELLFSYIYRTAGENALSIPAFITVFVYGKSDGRLRYDKGLSYGTNNPISYFAKAINTDACDLFLNSTLYPLISVMVTKEQQTHIVNWVFRQPNRYPRINTPIWSEIQDLKVCPLCMQAEKEEFGYFWYHRAHNIPSVSVCHKHGIPLKKYIGPLLNEMEAADTDFEDIPCEDVEKEHEISVFAYELLKTNIDCDIEAIRPQIIDLISYNDFPEKFEVYRDYFLDPTMTYKEFRKEVFQLRKDIGFSLRTFYIIFRKVEFVRPIIDHKTVFKLLTEINDYATYDQFQYKLVKLGKRFSEEEPYVTTFHGFNIGWRNPVDETMNEQEKYEDLLRRTKDDTYIPISKFNGMNKPVTVLCKCCGQKYTTSPQRLLNERAECPCRTEMNLTNLQKKYDNNFFKIIGFTPRKNGPQLKVKCFSCGEEFLVTKVSWDKHQICKKCGTKILIDELGDILISDKQTNVFRQLTDDDLILGAAAFERDVKNLTGIEYSISGDYLGRAHTVAIKHNVCGNTKNYTPNGFCHGERCACRNVVKGKDFIWFVNKYTCGKYTCERCKVDHYYVENTITHEKKLMRKRMILQELLRPTPSEILPLDKKNHMVSPYKENYSTIVRKYLRANYAVDDLIVVRDLDIPGVTKRFISSFMVNRKELVTRASPGVYRYLGDNTW